MTFKTLRVGNLLVNVTKLLQSIRKIAFKIVAINNVFRAMYNSMIAVMKSTKMYKVIGVSHLC